MAAAANDWGIPDWRDARAYGAVKNWNENRWRWEFTRRRKDYRADFDRYADESYAHALELYKKFKPDGRRARSDQILKPTDSGFTATMPGPRKYGLNGLPNPRISDQPFYVIMFGTTYGCAVLGEGKEFLSGGQGVSIDLPEGSMAITFDLALPIKPQLKGLQPFLEDQQKLIHGKVISRRRHPGKWLTYLRVLDGRAAGASWSELTAALSDHMRSDFRHEPQAAAQVYRAAETLMFNWPT
jgi:hypothetical protein